MRAYHVHKQPLGRGHTIHTNRHPFALSYTCALDSDFAQALRDAIGILILFARRGSETESFPPGARGFGALLSIMRALGASVRRPRARSRSALALSKAGRATLRGSAAARARHGMMVRGGVRSLALDLGLDSRLASGNIYGPTSHPHQHVSRYDEEQRHLLGRTEGRSLRAR